MKLTWPVLCELEEMYGDSFFLLDFEAFELNYDEFLQAFQTIYPKTEIAYSYKTNYTPRLIQRVKQKGGYAEVVSKMEYDLAVKIGVPQTRIIFNGPYKGYTAVEKALLAGAVVNLDGLHEVAFVEKIAAKYPRSLLNVGIRCNFDEDQEQHSRFGFDVAHQSFHDALQRLKNLQNCRIGGFHCHILTGNRSPDSYRTRARKMIELTDRYLDPDQTWFINLGGGFFSKMADSLKAQFSSPIPGYTDYAAAIAPVMAARYSGEDGPELILEPGMALVADIMHFVARIIEVKEIGSRRIAVSTGSVHDIKPTLNKKNLPLQIVGSGNRDKRPDHGQLTDIVGYTCMEKDRLYRGYEGGIAAKDFAVFANVGAYTNVLKPPFIKPAPPIITYKPDDETFELVRRRETGDDLFATYIF